MCDGQKAQKEGKDQCVQDTNNSHTGTRGGGCTDRCMQNDGLNLPGGTKGKER